MDKLLEVLETVHTAIGNGELDDALPGVKKATSFTKHARKR